MVSDLQECYQKLGFTEPPFRITPDTEFFFPGHHHLQALDHLRFGVASGGLTLLTGEVGTGKTLLCRYFLRNPPQGIRFAYLLNPDQSYVDLLASIYEDLSGHIPVDRTIGSLQRALYQMLLQLAKQGERVAVMVDEAHRLSGKVLEGLRLLSNLDTEKEKLMCLLFVGQPELERKLSHHALRPLSQRISIRFRLPPFDCQETTGYIQHRLWIAGHHSRCPIPKRVMMLVHYMSGGVPRCINQLCDRALLAAYSKKKTKVNVRMMWKARREIAGAT